MFEQKGSTSKVVVPDTTDVPDVPDIANAPDDPDDPYPVVLVARLFATTGIK